MIVGYARTSTATQLAGLEGQHRELIEGGADRVFAEQVSSVAASRKELAAAIDFCRAGDVLMVTKPDRLARSTVELLTIVDRLTARDVGVVILSMGGERLDTRNPTSKLILTVLSGVANWEREIMLERQREGIQKARADGKYQGRAPTAQRKAAEVRKLRAEGLGATEIANRVGISRASVYRIPA